MMKNNNNIGTKTLEFGLMTLYRNPVIVILMSFPAILVIGITAYVLLNEYGNWTAGGSVVSIFNPYQSVIYSISQIGKYLIPLTYILIPAAYAISDMQGGFMLKVLPVGYKTRCAYSIFQMSLIIILSVMFAYLAFILCIRIIGICRPLLDINAYDIWDNLLLFFVRMLAVALLIALTQLIMHIFIEKIWIPITIALLLMTIPAHGGYNIYSGGVGWMWLGFNNCIGFMSDFTSYLKMLLVCFVLILITIVWKRR